MLTTLTLREPTSRVPSFFILTHFLKESPGFAFRSWTGITNDFYEEKIRQYDLDTAEIDEKIKRV